MEEIEYDDSWHEFEDFLNAIDSVSKLPDILYQRVFAAASAEVAPAHLKLLSPSYGGN
jgi:hypothetical protein